MIAALPMYDRAEIRPATDRFWGAIAEGLRARGVDAPPRLTRGRNPWEIWRDPGLLLAQTCGLPFRARLRETVGLVGTPDYAVPGCPPGHYRSVVVVRSGAAAPADGARLAFNDPLSQSGWAAALDWAADAGLRVGARVETGAHAASALAVADGRADFAALDAVTWRLLRRFDPVAGRLEEIGRTAPRPGLPFVTARDRDPAPIAAAVAEAIAALTQADREALGLAGLVAIPAADYLALPIPPSPAADAEETGMGAPE